MSMTEPTQYWWNDTKIEYLCDERTPDDKQWKEIELISEGVRMKGASAAYCNASATFRGGDFVSISGGIDKNGSTWGCSPDGEKWTWYSADGNGESWTVKVLCAWEGLDNTADITTWLSSDPSGKTSIALGSYIGLPSDDSTGETRALSFFPTISQPAPVDLNATSTTASSSGSKETGTSSGEAKESSGSGEVKETGASKSASDGTTAKATASASNSHSTGTTLATTLDSSSSDSPSSSDSSSSDSSSTSTSMSTYIMVGVATFVVVGGLLFLALCMGKRNKKRRNKDESEDESLLSSDDDAVHHHSKSTRHNEESDYND